LPIIDMPGLSGTGWTVVALNGPGPSGKPITLTRRLKRAQGGRPLAASVCHSTGPFNL